ncbi:MAG: tetratricopeptide repeat protein [Phycisphaerae bacterium]|jgi:tetratricopeptide (TPR) repeat protein
MQPTTPTSLLFPKPSTEDLFERWCLILFRTHFGGSNWDRFRGRGRPQHGIDILGCDQDKRSVAVQCKMRNTGSPLTMDEIKADVKKARKLDSPPAVLIFATTDESKKLQQEVLKYSKRRQAAGAFPVEIRYWGDLCDLANDHREIHARLWSTLRCEAADNLAAAGISQNQNFVGRTEELARLHKMLTVGSTQITQAIVGEGGIGKSELAKQYVFEFADEWDGRWWLDASEAAIEAATARLAERLLGDDAVHDHSPNQIRIALVNFLSGEKHLLVLDNIQSAEQAKRFALQSPARVLITTRRRDIPPAVAGKLELEVLDREDAIKLLTSGREDLRTAEHRPTLKAIVDHLGCHALAVAVAGARLSQPPPPTPAELLTQLQEAEVGTLNDPFEEGEPNEELGTGYRHKVAASLSLHLPTFANTPAARLLELAAFCHPSSIPADLLADAAGLPLAEAKKALRELHNVSIVKCDEAVSIHRLTQSVMRAKLADTARREALAALVGVMTKHFADPDEYRRWAEMDRYAAHATAVVEHADKLAGTEDAGYLANQTGLFLNNLGRFDAARQNTERGVAIAQKVSGPHHANVAAGYSNLATIQYQQGDLNAARENMEKAIAIELKHFAPDHPALATSFSNLALIQRNQGDLNAARENMEKAIAIKLKHFAPDHPSLSTGFSNLAMIQHAQGDLNSARENTERAIAIELRHFAADHPKLATRYSNLAVIQKDLNDLVGARTSAEKAIGIQLKQFTPDHPDLAIRYHNLAGVLAAEKDFAGAAEWETKALGILLKHFKDAHPTVKLVRKTLARYRAQAEAGK